MMVCVGSDGAEGYKFSSARFTTLTRRKNSSKHNSNDYNAASIEVLKGLEPVKRRPGMYTDTSRPNHLAQEVIDNSVDEAIAGYAKRIDVVLHKDGSLEVSDDGRGMPTDEHPEVKGASGVEVILLKLHAGAKFSKKDYHFSGGLHGVGVSVVNALSKRIEIEIKRDGQRYTIAFENGHLAEKLKPVNAVGQRNTGTKIHFWPDPKYFDTPKYSVRRLKHSLRAKAVLCPKLQVNFTDHNSGEKASWYFEDGLKDYLLESLEGQELLPDEPFMGEMEGGEEMVNWAVAWQPAGGETVTESYVNLIPTPQGGTHVNGLRSGLLASMREFCEFRNLLPRGIKLAPDDVWDRCSFILSLKMSEPQFSGQTKERLGSRQSASFVSSVVKDKFSLWLNLHTDMGEKLAEMAIESARRRLKASKKVTRKKITSGPALPGKLSDCVSQEMTQTELFLVEGDSAGGSAKQARDRQTQAVMPLRGKILNTWEADSGSILSSKEVHDIAVAIGVDPGVKNIDGLRYGKICILADADSDGAHIATLLCALFLKHFSPLVEQGRIYVAMPPLYRIDAGKEVYYALDEQEKVAITKRIGQKKKNAKINVQRFKGLGEMNPMQLRETTMAADTRRLIQLEVDSQIETMETMDMMLAKKRSADRKKWLEIEGDMAQVT
jgi:topoisomerase-4 subunit B